MLDIGTRIIIRASFTRELPDGSVEYGMMTSPGRMAIITEVGDIKRSYTGHQPYVARLYPLDGQKGPLPPEEVWIDETQFEVIAAA